MTLQPLPPAPLGVTYALTVPQSVLFADLSLRGSREAVFREVFGVEFEIGWVVIDDGAMSWDFRGDLPFAQRLFRTTDVDAALRRFISAMSGTARVVEITSSLLGPSANRRRGSTHDLLTDLQQYWDAYERHMTNLFTFWNVEQLLSSTLIDQLKRNGLDGEVQSGLLRFLQPSETNYFALERRHLARLAARFSVSPTRSTLTEEVEAALAHHVDTFGFLLAPFNLGAPPSVASVLDRLSSPETAAAGGDEDRPILELRADSLLDLPEPLREVGLLAQELTFWKTERLDVMSLGDARAAGMYRAAAETLAIDTDRLFAMRRDEIATSLADGEVVVADSLLDERLAGYCLLLSNGEIEFYEPSRTSASRGIPEQALDESGPIRGIPVSHGKVTGLVRVIIDLSDIERIKAGDVLVTTMTRPEMGAALDRAAAFVTDQGGLMSHAAIIAREMGKPCVIGTEVATLRLRDEMRVLVDGDEGTVTILD